MQVQAEKRPSRRWTSEEDRLLGTAADDEVARQLGRTRVAVTMRRSVLGIPSANAKGPKFSDEQKALASAPDPTVLEELRRQQIEVPRQTLSPEDEERFKLVHGPYYPPRTWRGAFLVCEWRGTVKVGGYSDAPIPWPCALRTGYRSLILCGDLVRAVKLEAEQAIAYHWKVSATTVGKWRQVLGVEQWNPGSQRLLWHAVELARTPQAREKIAKAATGRVLSPEHRERLRALNSRPKSEAFKQLMSERMRRRVLCGTLRPWTAEEEALLDTMPDRELAKKLGRSVGAVAERRFLKRAGKLQRPSKASRDDEPNELVRASSSTGADPLNQDLAAVQPRRRAASNRSVQTWGPDEDEILRRHSIAEAARMLQRSRVAIQIRRGKLGLTQSKPVSKPWTPEELRLLGTKPDRILASKFKRRTAAVQQKRKSLRIPLCPEKHLWQAMDDNLLGKYSDEEVAKFLKVSIQSVKMRRTKLGIPIKDSQVRPWTEKEERLVGTVPDQELARKLGRSVLSIRMKRAKMGIRYR